jgi:hypothetical protein
MMGVVAMEISRMGDSEEVAEGRLDGLETFPPRVLTMWGSLSLRAVDLDRRGDAEPAGQGDSSLDVYEVRWVWQWAVAAIQRESREERSWWGFNREHVGEEAGTFE